MAAYAVDLLPIERLQPAFTPPTDPWHPAREAARVVAAAVFGGIGEWSASAWPTRGKGRDRRTGA